MQGLATDSELTDSVVVHPFDPEDAVLSDAMRAIVRSAKGVPLGIEARAQFDAQLDLWMGMPHGFPGSVGKLKAPAQALDAIAAFLGDRLHTHASP